jgi:hypothetical protein
MMDVRHPRRSSAGCSVKSAFPRELARAMSRTTPAADRLAGIEHRRRGQDPETGATMARSTVFIGSLLLASPAMAFETSKLGQGGSLPLDEIMPLIDRQPELKREITEAAAKLSKKPEDIICDGMRFPGQWEHLGGSRVSPYTCGFGDKWLHIVAAIQVTDDRGNAFDKITPQAMKKAQHVSETNLAWTWTTEAPK